jgi:hypothetical protein
VPAHARRRFSGRDPEEEHRASTPLELLYDLTLVVAFGTASDELAHFVADDHVAAGVGGFVLAAFAVSWAWVNYSWFASAYDTDDWVFRLATMVQMVGVIILSLGAAFFCAEIVIGPMWSIPMDIAGKFSGTAAGMMNTGSALAAILSPIAFGYIIDATGNWQLPFAGSLGFLLLGAFLAPTMHPERAFGDESSNRVIG